MENQKAEVSQDRILAIAYAPLERLRRLERMENQLGVTEERNLEVAYAPLDPPLDPPVEERLKVQDGDGILAQDDQLRSNANACSSWNTWKKMK